eukprot:GFUD01023834.1.p1 GENE.GFUD01023834.1~~GFUD01023834.1.p1  ORF type:complete len:276 (+),score=62.66 GFUD01023834.1:52-879(+)
MHSIKKSKLASLLGSSSLIPTDVTFEVRDEDDTVHVFKAHKHYLALVSDIFEAKFFGPMKETKETEVVEVTTSQAFGTMIDYVYDKDSRWEGKNVMELFEIANAADYYDVSGMMEKVTEVVAKVPINLATVVYLASIAELFSTMFNDVSQILLDKCASFLSQTLLTHVLDFSGLFSPGLFSPQHASTALRLHNMMEMPMPCTNCKQFLCQDTLPVPQDVHPGCIVSHPEANVFFQWKVTGSNEEGNVSLSASFRSSQMEKENIAVSEGMTYCCRS